MPFFYHFAFAGLSVMESHSLITTLTLYHAIEAALVILFAGNIFLTIILTEDKSLRLTLWFFAVTTVLSFAPMMIVNQSGYRTYYTTFVCIAIMALWLLRRHITEYFKSSEKKAQLQRHISTAASSLLLALTLVLFLQSVCNYDFYVMRSNYIAEKITAREDYSVPCMPYEAISVEDTWNGIIRFAYPSAGDS